METQSDLISQIREQLGLAPEEWEGVVYPMLERYAEIVHLLPASEAHHHRGAGGLFRHGLEAGFWACRSAENKIFTKAQTPQERRGEGKRWEVAALTGGLAHDVGKTISDVAVTDREGVLEWNPHQPLAQWILSNGVKRYFLHWNANREHKRHESFSVLFMAHIIQGTTKGYLLSHPEVMDQLLKVVSGQGEATEFGKVILWADRQSVSRDLKHQRISPDEFAYGVPVEKYVLDALRTLIGTKEHQPNKPPFNICVSNDGVYLKWATLVKAILGLLRKDDIRGVPSNPDTLARLLIERGLASSRPAPTKDSPDAYYLYHLIQPKPKGLSALSKHESDKYLLIHDIDMVFPSTALPQTMEVVAMDDDGEESTDVRSVRQPGGQVGEETEQLDASSTPPVDERVEPKGASDEDSLQCLDDKREQAQQAVSGVAEEKGSSASTQEEIPISIEDLMSGALKDESQSVVDSDVGNSSVDEATFTQAGDPEEDVAEITGAAVKGQDSAGTDEFNLDALIAAHGNDGVPVATNEQQESVPETEIPSYLLQGMQDDQAAESAPVEDDSVEYEAVADEQEVESGEGASAVPDVAPNTLPAEPEASIQNQASLESAESTTAQADSTAPERYHSAGNEIVFTRISSLLASTETKPEDLLAEADSKETRRREQNEKFEKRRKKRVEKAARSSTDQFDIDATLEARKRGRELTREDVRERNSDKSMLRKEVEKLDLYVPEVDPDRDKAVTESATNQEKVDLDTIPVPEMPTNRGRVDIDALLNGDTAPDEAVAEKTNKTESRVKGAGLRESHGAGEEPRQSRAGAKKKRRGNKRKGQSTEAAQNPAMQGHATEAPVPTSGGESEGSGVETSSSQPRPTQPSKEGNGSQAIANTLLGTYQKLQDDLLKKAGANLPDIDVALIADNIINAVLTGDEPLGRSAYFNSDRRLLIHYPEGIERHLPARPKTHDTGRIAREMHHASIVSQLKGERPQDGPVQRDPETGNVVLALTIAINKLVNRLFQQAETCLIEEQPMPVLAPLTHRSHVNYEQARKEIQSSIDRHKADTKKAEALPEENEPTESEVGNPSSIAQRVSESIQDNRSQNKNRTEAIEAVLQIICEQIEHGGGTLIEDEPIYDQNNVPSVQESVITRASKSANNNLVNAIGVRNQIKRNTTKTAKRLRIAGGRVYVKSEEVE